MPDLTALPYLSKEKTLNANVSLVRYILIALCLCRLTDCCFAADASPRTFDPPFSTAIHNEWTEQYLILQRELNNKPYYESIAAQAYDRQALILPEDRDPADIVFRRTSALVELMEKQIPPANGNSSEKDLRRISFFQSLKAQLNEVKPQINAIPIEKIVDRANLYRRLCTIRRQVVLCWPLLDIYQLVFVKKHRATFNHLCDQYYGRNLVPGGGIFLLRNPFSLGSQMEAVDVLAESVVQSGRLSGTRLNTGAFATLDLDYSGRKIAFGYVEATGSTAHLESLDLTRGHWEQGRCLHIFTANLFGGDLKQITDGTWNDFYPCFLPNDRLAFITERRGGYLRCGRECPNYTVFDMNQDGSQMRCLSYHETNEWAPSVSNDGKILWTRWDYIDRHGCTVHHPWQMSLNGSDPRQVQGNYTIRRNRSDTEMDVRAIPGSKKLVATGGPHHGQNYGSLVVIDPSQAALEDKDDMSAVRRLTPDVGFPESQGGAQVWGFPYPLSEDLFLAVADYSILPKEAAQGNPAIEGRYGIYVLDRFGNRELIYRDPEIGCATVIPVRERQKPIVVPELVEPGTIAPQNYLPLPERDLEKRPQATVTVANVYQSQQPWPEGTKIAALRVVQLFPMSVPSGPRPHEVGFREASSLDSVNLVRGVLGTVPVESDGSAHFTVPAQAELLFQALDEQGRAVQSMRSGTYFQPGDNVSCVGCHEPHGTITRSDSALPIAFKRAPSKLVPDIDGSRPANFVDLVQPILERHCVECHAKPESKTFSLAKEPYVNNWYQSYQNLMKNGFGFYNYGNPVRTIPGQFGAIKSPLLPLLCETNKKGGHYGVKLTKEEKRAIAVWLDMLSPFYGCYEKELGQAQLRGEKVYPTLE